MNDAVKIFKSLSDATRMAMVKKLAESKELSCQQLSQMFELSQPTISFHCNKLVDAGVVNERKEGIWRFYILNKKFLKDSGIDLKKMFR